MAVRFLPYPRFQAFDDNGAPLSGGKVFVYDAGTTNKIDTWTDFDKSSKNANPVILDSNGEADIFFDKQAKIVLKNSNDVTRWTLDDVTPLTSQTVTGKYNLVENGSFELDGDGDNVPDNWNTTSSTSTATIEIDTTTVAHGTNSFKFDSAGAGAGTATTANKFPVPDGDNVGVSFFVSSNNTTATNKVDLIFYDSAGNNTSTTNVWTGSGTQPSSLTLKSFGVSVPAGKTQADVKLTGVSNSETATTYFDNVQVLAQSYLFTGTPGEVTADASDLNELDGATLKVSNVSATATEVNVLDGYTGNTTDLNNIESAAQWTLIDTQTASSSSSLDFTSGIDSTHIRYMIVIDHLLASQSAALNLRTSTDGGSTWDSSSYDWEVLTSSGTTDSGAAASEIEIFSDFSGSNLKGEIIIETGGAGGGTQRPNVAGDTWLTLTRSFSVGRRDVDETINAVRLLPSAGNISSGTAYLYGWKDAS